jgi:calpain-15
MSHVGHQKWNTYTWKRPTEVYGEGNFARMDTISPDDIYQGDCGDCYFLSGISSLAEFPERIRRIFKTK